MMFKLPEPIILELSNDEIDYIHTMAREMYNDPYRRRGRSFERVSLGTQKHWANNVHALLDQTQPDTGTIPKSFQIIRQNHAEHMMIHDETMRGPLRNDIHRHYVFPC